MAVYAKFKYHATLSPVIVNDAPTETALGAAWQDTPAAFGIVTAPSVSQIPAELVYDAQVQAIFKAESDDIDPTYTPPV
jgi:hypothetical protein